MEYYLVIEDEWNFVILDNMYGIGDYYVIW